MMPWMKGRCRTKSRREMRWLARVAIEVDTKGSQSSASPKCGFQPTLAVQIEKGYKKQTQYGKISSDPLGHILLNPKFNSRSV